MKKKPTGTRGNDEELTFSVYFHAIFVKSRFVSYYTISCKFYRSVIKKIKNYRIKITSDIPFWIFLRVRYFCYFYILTVFIQTSLLSIW